MIVAGDDDLEVVAINVEMRLAYLNTGETIAITDIIDDGDGFVAGPAKGGQWFTGFTGDYELRHYYH